jgi:hypothetical protein
MKKDALGVTCSTYGINEKSLQNLVGKPEGKIQHRSPSKKYWEIKF